MWMTVLTVEAQPSPFSNSAGPEKLEGKERVSERRNAKWRPKIATFRLWCFVSGALDWPRGADAPCRRSAPSGWFQKRSLTRSQ